jgi:hypothetical protein
MFKELEKPSHLLDNILPSPEKSVHSLRNHYAARPITKKSHFGVDIIPYYIPKRYNTDNDKFPLLLSWRG